MEVLKRDWWCVGVNRRTGQEIDTGYVPAGALVRNVVAHEVLDELSYTHTAEVSTDGGQTWHLQRGYSAPLRSGAPEQA